MPIARPPSNSRPTSGWLTFARDVPVKAIAAVRASRGTSRLFLIGAASPSHAQYLTQRLTDLENSPWAPELRTYWPD